jgi:Fe-S-cluster containining protein
MSEYLPTIKFMDVSGELEGYLALRLHSVENSQDFVCMFLDSESGKCTIQSFKPKVCRFYPHWPISDDNNSVDSDDSSKNIEKIANYEEDLKRELKWVNGRCPRPWKLSQEETERFKQNYVTFHREIESYKRKVKIWNENYHDKGIPELLKYIFVEEKDCKQFFS